MKSSSGIRFLFLAVGVLLAAVVLLGAGCSGDDDPIAPTGENDPQPLITSPDFLVSLFYTAVSESDAETFSAILAEDFHYLLEGYWVQREDLPTGYLNHAETLQCAGAIFDGETVDNILGEIAAPVVRIDVNRFEKIQDWADAGLYGDYPGSLRATYRVDLFVARGNETHSLAIDQFMYFYATSADTTLSDGSVAQNYRLIGIRDVSTGKSENAYWGQVLCSYLEPEPPIADLVLTDAGGFPHIAVSCDASGSSASLHGLHETAFSFFAVEDDGWTEGWQESPSFLGGLTTPGTHTVYLEVRDRWEQKAAAQQEITLALGDPPAATTVQQLMTNFRDCYDEMLIEPLIDLLHPEFKFILLAETRDDWGWVPDYNFDRATTVSIHTRMFRGDPGLDALGNPVHPIDRIDVNLLAQQQDWSAIDPEDPYFGDFEGSQAVFAVFVDFYNADLSHRFRVTQEAIFYAMPVTEGDEMIYQLLGIHGLPTGWKTDEVSWDGILSLYR